MENQRFLLYTALALVLYLIWTSLQGEHSVMQDSDVAEIARTTNAETAQSQVYQ